jgi:hypothetical protein
MTPIAKILTVAIPLVLAGALIHESRNVARLRNDVRQLQSQRGESSTGSQEIPRNKRFSREDRERARREKEELKRREAAADESIRRQRAEYAANPPLTSAMDMHGQVSKEAIQKLSLSAAEIDLVSELIDRVRAESDNDFLKRLKLVSSKRDKDGSKHHAYYARARADRGKVYLEALSAGFAAALGKDRSGELMKGFYAEYFIGAMGKYDMELEFTRKANDSGRVKYQFRSPKTGEACRFGEKDLDEFQREFGNVVTFPGTE